jgi:transposase
MKRPRERAGLDRTILGCLSKRGNGYLRMLFMQAARVILLRPANWPKHGFGAWLVRAAQRLHPNVLAAALANKLARIAWTVLAQGISNARPVHTEGPATDIRCRRRTAMNDSVVV